MTWQDLRREVESEFGEFSSRDFALLLALSSRSARLKANAYERVRLWRLRHPERYAEQLKRWRERQALLDPFFRRRRTVLVALARMRGRPPVTCANRRCGVVFVPYRRDTRYCTKACRKRASTLRAHRARRANPAKHQAHLAYRRARYAQGFNP